MDYLPLSRVVQFAVGVLCGVAMRRGMRAPVDYPLAVVGVIGFHLLLQVWESVAADLSRGWGPYSGSQWWSMPFFTLLIMAAAQRDLDGRPTGVRSPVWIRLGHWSYAWYLIHEVVIRVWRFELPRPEGLGDTLLTWAVLLLLTQAAAGALYTLVEHPAERFLRRIGPQPRKVDGSKAPPAARTATSGRRDRGPV